MKIKKFMTSALVLALSLGLSACGGGGEEKAEEATSNEGSADVSVTMVTDQGGVNDKSFNQSTYEGLKEYEEAGKVAFDYIESHKDSDYQPNLESALDSQSDIILTVGYALYDATSKAADANPDQLYAIIDNENVDSHHLPFYPNSPSQN